MSMLKKFNLLFYQSDSSGTFDVKIDRRILRRYDYPSFLNWTKALTLSLMRKLPPRKIGALICSKKFLCPEFALNSDKATIKPYIDYFCHVQAVPPVTSKCQISFGNRYIELLVLDLLTLLNPRLIVQMQPAKVFSIDITYANVNWLNWFFFLILGEGLIGCVTFVSPLLDIVMMSTSIVSFLAQLDSGILCLQNTFF